jgi:hypothetical protein
MKRNHSHQKPIQNSKITDFFPAKSTSGTTPLVDLTLGDDDCVTGCSSKMASAKNVEKKIIKLFGSFDEDSDDKNEEISDGEIYAYETESEVPDSYESYSLPDEENNVQEEYRRTTGGFPEASQVGYYPNFAQKNMQNFMLYNFC